MFEILVTTVVAAFVAAFVLIALFGHVMVAKAMMKSDRMSEDQTA